MSVINTVYPHSITTMAKKIMQQKVEAKERLEKNVVVINKEYYKMLMSFESKIRGTNKGGLNFLGKMLKDRKVPEVKRKEPLKVDFTLDFAKYQD